MNVDDGVSGVIITPEAVVLDLATGGVVTRLVAGLIDMAARIVILLVMSLLLMAVRTDALMYGLVFFVLLGYSPLLETFFGGRTFGKMAVRQRVVTIDGSPIRFRHAALRSMGGLVDFLFPPGGITGLLFVWGTARNQRIGDLLAGTIVVSDRPLEYASAAFWFTPPYGYEAWTDSLDTTALRNDDYTLARSFLLRVHQLTPSARYATADRISAGVARRLNMVRPPSVHPETFLICVLARYQRVTVPSTAIPSQAWNRP